jgi:predicted DNA-binding ribbon-helix-helix protein
MKNSAVIKRSIKIDGRKTAVSLEDDFWAGLKEIAQFKRVTLSELVTSIAATRKRSNLSSAIRIFVLEHFQHKVKREGLAQSGDQIEIKSA